MATVAPNLDGRVRRANPFATDGLLVLIVTSLALSTLFYRAFHGPEIVTTGLLFGAGTGLAIVLLLAGTACLVWQRQAALPVLAVSSAAYVVSEMLGSLSPLLPFAPVMALYAVAANRAPAVSGSAAGVLATGALLVSIAQPGTLDDDYLDYLFSVGGAWLLGYGVRLNRARTSLLEDQAKQLARQQTAKTEAAVKQEHSRIARDLHDVVAHHLVIMVAQAGAAKRVFNVEPDQARQALGSIETIGRDALVEMRRLLGVLWSDGGGPDGRQLGLGELPALAAQMKQAGLPVRLIQHGSPQPLPASVELNAYRIVQEALTNTLKHAGPTRADVEVTYHPEFLQLRVSDDGRGGARNPTPGHGLLGMEQRALLLHGEVTVGPGPSGGFQVDARLPVNGGRL